MSNDVDFQAAFVDQLPFDFAIDEMDEQHQQHNNNIVMDNTKVDTGDFHTGACPDDVIEKTLSAIDDEDDQNALEMEMIRHLTQPMRMKRLSVGAVASSSLLSPSPKRKPRRKRGKSLEEEIRKLILENEATAAASRNTYPHKFVDNCHRAIESCTMSSNGQARLSTDDILNDLDKTAEEVDVMSSSGGYNCGGSQLHSGCGDVGSYDQGYEEEQKEVSHEEEDGEVPRHNPQPAAGKDTSTKEDKVVVNKIVWSNKWTAFGSFSLCDEVQLDENGFPIMESKIPTQQLVKVEDKEEKIVEEGLDVDSFSEAEEEEELARTLAAEFQIHENESQVSEIHKAECENHLDESSEIFENLATSTSEAVENTDRLSDKLEDRRRKLEDELKSGRESKSNTSVAHLSDIHETTKPPSSVFGTESKLSVSSSSFRGDNACSVNSAGAGTGNPTDSTDSTSELSRSSTSSTDEVPTSPSSVTHFSDDGSRSQQKRYLHAREFVKNRRSRSRTRPMRRVDRSPNSKKSFVPSSTSDEIMGKDPNDCGLRQVDVKWKPNPPKHYNRPISRI